MHGKKIIICKYHLKNKCKFGSKCNFVHIQKKEIEHNLEEVIKLRSENASLKTEFYKLVQENRKSKFNESTNASVKAYRVHALQKDIEKNHEEKITYSSLLKEKRLSQEAELVNKKPCANESKDEQVSDKNLIVIGKEIRNPNVEQIRSICELMIEQSIKEKENNLHIIDKLKQECNYVRGKLVQQEKANKQSEHNTMSLIKNLQREQKAIIERIDQNDTNIQLINRKINTVSDSVGPILLETLKEFWKEKEILTSKTERTIYADNHK